MQKVKGICKDDSLYYRTTVFVGDIQKALGKLWRNISEAEKTVRTAYDSVETKYYTA